LTLRRCFYITTFVLLTIACSTPNRKEFAQVKQGMWQLNFNIGDAEIPINLEVINTQTWAVHNGEETIILDSVSVIADSFYVKMPLFNSALYGRFSTDSTMKGAWKDYSRENNYNIKFTGAFSSHSPINTGVHEESTYDITLSPDSIDKSKSIGLFKNNNGHLTGTFLTETGDFRYLEGLWTGESMTLSCFDGTHLFYFCANIVGDSLKDGVFHSGTHWTENWCGKKDPHASLRDPDELTFLKPGKKNLSFRVRGESGDSLTFDSTQFLNQVTIIQIFGSWCPNCTDESRFMKELYKKYHSRGLKIIPVAFERSADFMEAKTSVKSQFQELGLDYPVYFGGGARRTIASLVFSDLTNIGSFPTTIFIDKKGAVRKIHTGFYGPGTGSYYFQHCEKLDMFVDMLLNE
jgi:thiol-disulfide isomerase/thioredoxin